MRYISSDEDFKFWDFLVYFDFPKLGPVSFIITDFNVFVQFFE
jgi:hypothetical protein